MEVSVPSWTAIGVKVCISSCLKWQELLLGCVVAGPHPEGGKKRAKEEDRAHLWPWGWDEKSNHGSFKQSQVSSG